MAYGLPAYEQGPIRPPSESESLLLRLTRNCPWNRCLFCPVYKGKVFSRRSPEEIKKDISAMADAAAVVKEISIKNGFGGEVNRQTAALIQSQHPELFQIAYWLYKGGKTVFLQDGDSLLLPVSQLVDILEYLQEKFPSIERITTYARSRTLLRRSVDDLIRLREAGLNRIHVGLESGNDRVLEFMQKGVTGLQHIEAGQRVKKAGISLSEYVILGLGGAELWQDHAVDSARVLNQINPDFIRIRTLAISPRSLLFDKVRQNEFQPLTDDAVIREEALFIENLEGIESAFYSDHILNLLEEVNGKLPGDKSAMLNIIKSYLAWPDQERELFRLGRRTGYFRSLGDISNPSLRSAAEKIYRQLQNEGIAVDDYIEELKLRFV